MNAPPTGTRPCKRCGRIVKRQHGRQFCKGCTKHDHDRRAWRKLMRARGLNPDGTQIDRAARET